MRHIFFGDNIYGLHLSQKYSLTAYNLYSNGGYFSCQEKYKLYEYKIYANSFLGGMTWIKSCLDRNSTWPGKTVD